MDRLISLQAAIDAVRDRMGKGETKIGDTFIECFEMILNALPSAEHAYTEEELQKMQDLEQAELDKAFELGQQDAQPERKTGKWLPDNTNMYEIRFVCSNCKESQVVPTMGYKPIWDWCPNCGAKMEGEQP